MPLSAGQDFLEREYKLMLTLKELNGQKPVVALSDGFVIGAGAGLFMAADTRITSLSSSFSMPEAVLGIVPDVGATDYLTIMPGQLSRWAAMTGARFAAPMMAATGIATHAIVAEAGAELDAYRQELTRRILACDDRPQLEAALRDEQAAAKGVAEYVGGETLDALCAAAERSFGGDDLLGLEARLTAEVEAAAAAEDATVLAWAKDARAKLLRGSPAALLLAAECGAAELGCEPNARRALALGMELAANQALACLSDFQEGVSCAVGAKKGEVPTWQHASLEAAQADPAMEAMRQAVRQAAPLTSL